MICPNGHEMHQEDVETVPAHQGWVNGGTEIIDASYQNMWVCDDCDAIVDPITEEVL